MNEHSEECCKLKALSLACLVDLALARSRLSASLRFDDPDNKGLINCIRGDFNLDGDTDPDVFDNTLHDVYKEFCNVVSLADFLVISAEAVMGFTETSAGVDLKSDHRRSPPLATTSHHHWLSQLVTITGCEHHH